MSSFNWQAERSHPLSVMREAVVLVMVGLPARGKSFISNSLVRYLRVIDVNVRAFNAGNLRRSSGSAGGAGAKADYFSQSNTEAKEERERLAMACCDEMLEWIYQQPADASCMAILDATNTTRERRERVLGRCRDAASKAALRWVSAPPLRVVFIESICDDKAILEGNYRMKLKNDDYKDHSNKDEALDDFKKRVDAYVEQYHPLNDTEVAAEEDDIAVGLVRMINGGQKLHFVQTGCSLAMLHISTLLSCFHLSPRRLFLVPEHGTDAARLAALLRRAEAEDELGRPVDLLCRASRPAVRLARNVEHILDTVHMREDEKGRSASTSSNLSKEGLRQPRGILCLRKLEPRCSSHLDASPSSAGRRTSGALKRVMQTVSLELPEETFSDLVDRMKEVIYTIERLPRSLVVLYPEDEVLRVLMAHFNGCPETGDPETMALPSGPIIELRRDHKGFSLVESPLPEPLISDNFAIEGSPETKASLASYSFSSPPAMTKGRQDHEEQKQLRGKRRVQKPPEGLTGNAVHGSPGSLGFHGTSPTSERSPL